MSGEYYADGNCHPCHSTCESCFGPSKSDCLSCEQSLRLQNSNCVGECTDGHFPEGGGCSPCLHTCTQCVSRQNCTACAPGLQVSEICKILYISDYIDIYEGTYSVFLNLFYYQQLQTGECRATCADGYYNDRGGCSRCYISCQTCSGPRRDQCVRCPTGWQIAAGECRPECPAGFYRGAYNCQRCHHSCRNCKGKLSENRIINTSRLIWCKYKYDYIKSYTCTDGN